MSSNDWKQYKLGEITKWRSGGTPSKSNENYWNGTIPWISAKTLNSNRVSDSVIKISEAGLKNGSRLADVDSILLLVRGSGLFNGIPIAIVKKQVAYNQDIKEIIPDKNHILPEFLLYWFESSTRLLNSKMESTGIGAGKFDTEIIQNLDIKIPSFQIQAKIVEFIKSLDDKIENNLNINQTLEEIARTLFNEMCLPKGDELPTGWRVGKLGDFLESVSETYKFGEKEKIIFLNTGDIQNGAFLHSDYSDVSKLPGQAKKKIRTNDILFSEIRPINRRFAFVDFDGEEYVVSTKLMVLRSKGLSPIFLYFYLTRDEIIKELQHQAEARSGTFPQITFSHVEEIEIIMPPTEILDEFTKTLENNFRLIKQNEQQNQTLKEIRDSLLPKLMSGEIEVNG